MLAPPRTTRVRGGVLLGEEIVVGEGNKNKFIALLWQNNNHYGDNNT